MDRLWESDPAVGFRRRIGKSASVLGDSRDEDDCPDIWELDNGDVAIIGRDHSADYHGRLPHGVTIGADERLVVIPGNMLRAAKPDIADA